MKQIINRLSVIILMFIFILAGCSTPSNTSKIADSVKTNVSALTNMTTGEVSSTSITTYYTDIDTKWDEIIASKPPKEYLSGIEAQKTIATTMKTLFATSTEKNAKTNDIYYIGKENNANNKNVSGIFIYNLVGKDTSAITEQVIIDANSFTKASKTGEYFHQNGDYLITCEYGFIENEQELFAAIDKQIAELK